jgi:hypothetical protein
MSDSPRRQLLSVIIQTLGMHGKCLVVAKADKLVGIPWMRSNAVDVGRVLVQLGHTFARLPVPEDDVVYPN